MPTRNSIQAQPPLQFIPPALNGWLVGALPFALPLWLRLGTPLARFEAHNAGRLAELYRDFQAGKVRFLIAFRHPSTYDPFAMGYLLSQVVPREAQAKGIFLKRPVHSYFLYDRGIPLWAGPLVGWLLPRLGGTPIQRGKVDRQGLKSARDILTSGTLPLMAAPEGGTNGHSELVSPLEPGIAQMGFWCAEDLAAAGRNEKVFIVPVGLHYSYLQPPWEAIDSLLTRLEQNLGIAPGQQGERYERLLRIGDTLLGLMENFYTRFYFKTPKPISQTDPQARFGERLRNLLEVCLEVAEQFFNMQAKGSLIDRCRRIEQAGWDRIYRDELKEGAGMSPVERGLADRIAEETDLRMWHMRLVESFVAVTDNYVRSNPSADRFAETALIAWRTVQRMKGEDPNSVLFLGKQKVRLSVGEPLNVSDRFAAYSSNRQGARQAVAELTAELQAQLETMAR